MIIQTPKSFSQGIYSLVCLVWIVSYISNFFCVICMKQYIYIIQCSIYKYLKPFLKTWIFSVIDTSQKVELMWVSGYGCVYDLDFEDICLLIKMHLLSTTLSWVLCLQDGIRCGSFSLGIYMQTVLVWTMNFQCWLKCQMGCMVIRE